RVQGCDRFDMRPILPLSRSRKSRFAACGADVQRTVRCTAVGFDARGAYATHMAAAPRRPSIGWVLLIAGAITTTLAFAIAAQTYLSMRTHGHSFLQMLAWQLACWNFWAF